jgi:hypothetical protein
MRGTRGQVAALAVALQVGAAVAAPLHAEPPAASPTCDAESVLTPIGIDTTAGRVLLALSSDDGKARWVLVLDQGADAVRAYLDAPAGRFSGSVGPGPVISVVPCPKAAGSEAACLQPLRFHDGAWELLGERVTAPAGASAAATYDPSGVPWLVLVQAGRDAGTAQVAAYRLEGVDWKGAGSQPVAGLGEAAALPAADLGAGITAGNGLFAATGRPQSWLEGLPRLAAERHGQVVPIPPKGGAYLAADGVLYLTGDHGKSWRRSTWTPWGDSGTVGAWRFGSDFTLDLPFGAFEDGLRLIWFDRRNPKEEKVYLTRRQAAGAWETLAELPAVVKSKNGDSLPLTHVFSPRGAAWEILFGCAATAGGSGLVVRTFDGKELSAPKFLPLRP